MLAERKKKVKWTLNPRGNSWSKDTNKFGQRMLEKMGWKSGEGLGVKKQGITEHIKVAYKNDNKCLGYKDNGEEWVEHQSQFESLLAELSSSHSTVAVLDSGKDKIPQTETLEQRSRHSRTRVHYQKFTRGKDLSKYSEKDLKCIILGKQKANSADEENYDNDGNNEHFNGFYGIRTINSGSMNDYFKKLTNLQNYSDTSISDLQFVEEEVSEKNNDVEKQYDVKVKKKKKRKAEMQMSDNENSNMDSNEVSNIKQHKTAKKYKVLEHSDSANNDRPYTDYESGSISESKLQGQDITDPEGTIIDGICNELHCDEIYEEKKPKKRKNCSIQDRECEVMEVGDEIEDRQVKKKSKKKNSELVNEGKETSLVPIEDVPSKSENSKAVVELLTVEVHDKIEVGQAKKLSRKKNPVSCSEEETSLVPVEYVLHDSKNTEDTGLHLTAQVEDKQKKKKRKKKKEEFTGDDRETSVITAEDVSHRLEDSKDTEDHLPVEGKQLKKKSKKKQHELLNESGEISVLPVKDVSCRLENSKDAEQHLTVELADEIEGKQLKKKSKKKKHELISEGVGTSVAPVEDILQMFENSENIVENIMGKDEEKRTKGTHGVHISPENNLKATDIKRLDHGASSDGEVRSNEQTAKHIMPTKGKKKKNIKVDDVENSVVENIYKDVNNISVEKKKHKRKKDENEVDGQSEQAEPVRKESKKTNADEDLQRMSNSIDGSSESIVNENITEKLNNSCPESPAKSHERYSIDEIKNMKSSLFVQLVDPRLVEFKGSNLHTIAGYGKW